MCCIAASLPCCNSHQLPVSIGYRTPLGSARLGGVLDILRGNGEFIFVCKVLRGKGRSGSLYSSSAPQNLGVCERLGSSLCVSFMERLFPGIGLSFAKFTLS